MTATAVMTAGEKLATTDPQRLIARAYLACGDSRVSLETSDVAVDADRRLYVVLRRADGTAVQIWRILATGRLKPMVRPPAVQPLTPWLAADEEAW